MLINIESSSLLPQLKVTPAVEGENLQSPSPVNSKNIESNRSGYESTDSTSNEASPTKRRRKSSSDEFDSGRNKPVANFEDNTDWKEDNDTDSMEEYLTADEGDPNLGDSKNNLTISGAINRSNLNLCSEL